MHLFDEDPLGLLDKQADVPSTPFDGPPVSKSPIDPSGGAVPGRSFIDPAATRRAIYDRAFHQLSNLPPVSNQKYTLSLKDVSWHDPEEYSRKETKKAILEGRTLTRRLRGTWTLSDNADGSPVATKTSTVAHVPVYLPQGTVLLNGSQYSLASQLRLRPGVFTRLKENGELDSHVNVLPGQGVSHHIAFDPESGLFRLNISQANYPLYTVLKAMGAKDKDLQEAWGDLYYANAKKDDPGALNKLHAKLVRGPNRAQDDGGRKQQIAEALMRMPMDPEVNRQTLGKPYANVSPEVYVEATKKLLGLSRGEIDPDDRDHLAFMTVHGPEDLISERVLKDQSELRRALWRATLKGDLSAMPAGVFSKSMIAAVTKSGLGQPLEQINPSMTIEQMGRISRMGVGGIPSTDSIPETSRAVQNSHFGYIDPISTPENMRAGVDSRVSNNARKGDDGRVYSKFIDARTGETKYVHPGELQDAVIAFPTEMDKDRPFVAAMNKGNITYVPREDVTHVLPSMEDAFGPISNLVPMKSAIKGQRLSMGARMTTQALPLVGGEAPFVQSGVPGDADESYEERYGVHMGAVRADQGGWVRSVSPDAIEVELPDKTVKTYELAVHEPSNRKTGLNQTPVVRPGQRLEPGQLIARSNYTDAAGATALGRNVRVAMLPGFGEHSNYEDAWVISRSAADKFRSEHYYQHEAAEEDGLALGKQKFVAAFPGKFPKATLDNFDADGVIRPGTEVKPGDPLILAVKQRESNRSQVYRGHGPSYVDKSETWDHHDPGVVTDAVRTKDGVKVVVRTESSAEVGDKLCLSADHDVLTDRGWLPIAEVRCSDLVACIKKGRSAFLHPLATHKYAHGGRMYEVHSKHVSLLATRNHRMYVQPEGERWFRLLSLEAIIGKRVHYATGLINVNRLPVEDEIRVTAYDDYRRPVYCLTVPGEVFYVRRRGRKVWTGNSNRMGGKGLIGAIVPDHLMPRDEEGRPAELLFNPAGVISRCYDDRTEFLTESGWKLGKDVFGSDRLLCFDKDGRGIDWGDQIAPMHSEHYRGDMIGAVTPHVDFLVTPNHKMFAYSRADGRWGEITAGRMFGGEWLVPHVDEQYSRGLGFATVPAESWTKVSYDGMVYCPSVETGYVVVRRNGKVICAGNTNPAAAFEFALGKIAEKTGKPYKIKDFDKIDDLAQFTLDEMEKHGVKDFGHVVDPRTGRKIDGVTTGNAFFMKLHHTSSSKIQGRGTGGYSAEGQPARGVGTTSAKRLALMSMNALLSSGATNVIRDGLLVRGQANPNYWLQFMSGHTPPTPEVPHVHQKFFNQLKAAGVNVTREGTKFRVKALRNQDIDELAEGRIIRNPETVSWKEGLAPIKGGLFDEALTGGHGGCFHPSVKVWTEDGMIPIGKIVRERIQTRVWSYDFESGEFVLRPIVNWFCNHSEEGIGRANFASHGRLAATKARFNPTSLWGTRGHQVYSADGTKHDLASVTSLVAARERFSYTQEQMIYGSLLGDGHVTRNGRWSETHCLAQVDYLDLKRTILGKLAPDKLKPYEDFSGGCYRHKARLDGHAHAELRAARALCYVDDRKTLSDAWLSRIDEMGLAFWLMDDGNTHRKRNKNTTYVSLSTHSFTLAEVTQLREWLYARWGLETHTSRNQAKYGDRPIGWMIVLAGASAEHLLDITAPYIPPSMQYKLGSRPRTHGCRYCDTQIQLIREICNGCLLRKAAECGPHKITKDIRRRIGNTATVRTLIATNTVPLEHDGTELWATRFTIAGDAIAAMRRDNRFRLDLETIPCEYQWQTGARWECTQTVYDIEVEGTHNYFANGILVSNSRWSSIQLHEPMPSPVFEEPIRRLLNLTKQQYRDVLAGKLPLGDSTGPHAIKNALSRIDVDKAIAVARMDVASGKKTSRDAAIRRLGYLKSAKKDGIHPKDWIWDKAPVLPPIFRPVSVMQANKKPLVADVNVLYKELMDADANLRDVSGRVDDVGPERLAVYDALKAVTGLDESIHPKTVQQGVRGLLAEIHGGSPKFGTVQRKLLSSPVDLVGRAVIVPNPDLDIDSVGVPESHAWEVYKPFIVRRLVRRGMKHGRAVEEVAQRTAHAREAMLDEMKTRPVILDRAPVLHRYGVMAFWPKLVKGDSIHLTPLVTAGYGADFDGDQMNYQVPASDEAVRDAVEKMLPSKNLLAASNFRVHQVPTREYAAGLWFATKDDKDDDRKPAVFRTKRDAVNAYRNGEIDVDQPVHIVHE